MSKYIMVINSIVNMGGGQQYCANKVRALQKLGFEVIVVSHTVGRPLNNELLPFSKNIIQDLMFSPNNYSKRQRVRVMHRFEKVVGDIDSETVIDTSNVGLSLWGEMIAKKHQCKHIIFCIDENPYFSKSCVRYIKFKHARKEFLCTSTKAVDAILSEYHLSDDEKYIFSPCCGNTFADIEYPLAEELLRTRENNIGYFGRLDKENVNYILKCLYEYARNNKNNHYAFVFIGGALNTDRYDEIHTFFNSLKNVKVIITGYLYPVPVKIFKCLKLCIATAGCTGVSYKNDVNTIYTNCLTGKAVGVLGYDLEFGKDYRYAEPSSISLTQYIQRIYNGEVQPRFMESSMKSFVPIKESIEKQMLYINSDVCREYYEVEKVRTLNRIKESMLKVLLYFLKPVIVRNIILNFHDLQNGLKTKRNGFKK